MTLDVATLFVASIAIEFVLALYFWTLWLGRREQRMHLWIAASITTGMAGSLGFMLRGVAPDWIAVWAAQVCFIQVFAFLWAGVRRVHGRTHPTRVVWAGSLLWSAACLIPAFFHAEAVRNAVATLAFTAYCVAMSAELLRRAGATSPSRRLTAALLLSLSAASVAMTVYSALRDDVVTPLSSPSSLPALWLLLYTAIYLTLVVALTTLELGNEAQRQREAAATDALTGLLNRRAFIDGAARLATHPRGATLLMLDLDHFKQINDHWGHAAGDRALVLFAGALLDVTVRSPHAVVARIGGEEFAVLLPGTPRADALAIAAEIAARTRELRHTPGAPRMTVSIGTAAGPMNDRTLDELLAAADQALYRAKRGGRDRVEQEYAPCGGTAIAYVAGDTDLAA